MEQELLRQLYGQYAHELYLYLYSLTGSRACAEDLLQETFLKALLALPDGHPNLRAWLYTVARNLFYNQRKRDSRLTPLQESQPSAEDDLPEILLRDERRRALYCAIRKLDARKREVLLLQYFSRLSQKEIAAALHLTPENVRVLACRARKELKAQLEVQGYDIP